MPRRQLGGFAQQGGGHRRAAVNGFHTARFATEKAQSPRPAARDFLGIMKERGIMKKTYVEKLKDGSDPDAVVKKIREILKEASRA